MIKTKRQITQAQSESKIEILKRNIRLMQPQVDDMEAEETIERIAKKKKKRVKRDSHKAFLDFLWSLLIKARAGFKSELSGETELLNSHHVVRKPNNDLRYSLENGFCCTQNEHIHGFHSPRKVKMLERKVKRLRGEDIYDKLNVMKTKCRPFNRFKMEEFLLNELGKYKSEILTYYNQMSYKKGKVKKFYEKLFELLGVN